ncbi:MAG: DUF3604 domain-containing protein [Nevskiales bacterium]
MKTQNRLLPICFALMLGACNDNSSSVVRTPGSTARQCRNHNALRNPYFGDLHVHTKYSLDANTQGTIIGPHEAYRFATGERLGIQPYNAAGEPLRFTQLARPLDFAAVTDHAELFGETEICTNPDYLEYNFPECILYRNFPEQSFLIFNLVSVGLPELPQFRVPPGVPVISDLPIIGTNGTIPRLPYCGLNGARCLGAAKTPWTDMQRAAEAYYDRSDNCRFTTFVGYEYTAAPLSNNLHRNVIFRSEVVPELPPAYQEYPSIEQLWQALTEQCRSAEGCEYLTIPHNSNLSAGLMFETKNRAGNDYTTEFAMVRQSNEPLVEIMQHKGQSECLNTTGAGMQDELCGFEVLPYNNLTGDRFGGLNTGPPKEQDFLRSALKEGLRQEQSLGVNPFKYGFIGSSDTHIGTPGNVLENAFPGHGGAGQNPSSGAVGLTDVIEANPGGLAVLWAEENTRNSLFGAMRRREAYATSGTRPIVRFFGGWNLPGNQCASADFASIGYARGVPMGGDLPAAPAGAKPRFALSALRDPGAAGEPTQALQRIQIIKGWIEHGPNGGEKKEAVYEVAGNPNNGASVDLANCEPTGAGSASLCAVWEDPNFDPAESAFYYARVVENPSCRWSTRQCLAVGVDCSNPSSVPAGVADCCNANYPKTVQERAWTSPIWYRPAL